MTLYAPETTPHETIATEVFLDLELEVAENYGEGARPYEITHISDGGWIGYDQIRDVFVLETSVNELDLSSQVGRAVLAGLDMMDRVLEPKEALWRAPDSLFEYRDTDERLFALEADSPRTYYEALGYAAMLPTDYIGLTQHGRVVIQSAMSDLVEFSHSLALQENALREQQPALDYAA